MLLEVRDDFVGIEMFFFQFLMMRSALEGISGPNVLSHVLEQFVGPSFFFRPHLSFVVLHEDNILSVFFLAPNTILWTRNIFLLLLWGAIVLLTAGTVVLRNKFFAVFH